MTTGDEPEEGPLVWPGCDPAAGGTEDAAGEEQPGPRSRLRRALVAGIALTGLVLATVSVVAVVRDGAPHTGERHPVLTAPADGPVRIRVVGSGLCLGERRDGGNGQVYQRDCADGDGPAYALNGLGAGHWRIVTDRPDRGPGCVGIRAAARISGAALTDTECGDPARVERFALEPYGSPVAGYRIRPVDTEPPGPGSGPGSGIAPGSGPGCVTVVGDPNAPWASLAQAPCRPDARGQLFGFDRVRP
ncbi:RICIN domain-containing protein [Streptomyces sp. NPDC004327]|uniref:RICIN domain-containing protein n=1 Tax=unclassified Streptomyces TaxID=2593676 RepID=UPI00369000C7